MQFIVQNNLPFNAASKLTMFVKDLLSAHSSTFLLKYKCDDSQVTKYISGAIAPILKDRYLKELETKPFWIALDEATNATVQYLAISVTFFEASKDLSPTTKLLSVIEVEESVTGQAIYEAVWKLLFEGSEGSRRQRNFIGVVTDGAKSMISTGDSGATNRLRDRMSHIIVTHDLCHSLNLMLKHTLAVFPQECILAVEKICQSFAQSPLKSAQLRSLIKELKLREKEKGIDFTSDNQKTRVLRFVPSRWSSFFDSLQRVIELEFPLKTYYEKVKPSVKKKFIYRR